MSKLKICFLADLESIHTQKWIRFFAERGYEVYLITMNPSSSFSCRNVTISRLKKLEDIPGLNFISFFFRAAYKLISVLGLKPKRTIYAIIYDLSCAFQSARIIKKIKPNIVHAHYATTYGFLAASTHFHPYLLTAWGDDILYGPKVNKWLRWKVCYALKRVDLITCDAEHMAEAMVGLGAKRQKIKQIRFGVDIDLFSPQQKSEHYKKYFNIPSSCHVIISTRNLKPSYDPESLIRAVPRVIQKIAHVMFVIVGNGARKNQLKELAGALGVLNYVAFVDPVPNEEIPKYLVSSDVYVSMALTDGGISASTSEAMACGLPVIITDVMDNNKWVQDGVNGFIVPPKDSCVLADRIIELLKQSDEERMVMGIKARKTIEEKNNYVTEMLRMESYYQLNSKP